MGCRLILEDGADENWPGSSLRGSLSRLAIRRGHAEGEDVRSGISLLPLDLLGAR